MTARQACYLQPLFLTTINLNQSVGNFIVDLSRGGFGVVAPVEGERHRLVRVGVLGVDGLLRLRDKDGALVVDLVHEDDVLKQDEVVARMKFNWDPFLLFKGADVIKLLLA